MDKILTISIANYNNGSKLAACLDSLLDEKINKDLDIIVVNDGSKDNSMEVVKPYLEKYPNTVRVIDKANGGYGSTINASLKEAKGKYYRLLDADDSYETKSLIDFVGFLKKCDTDVVYSDFLEVNINSGDKNLVSYSYPTNQTLDVSNIGLLRMHSLTIKTSIIQNNISITEHCFYTDMEFAVKCLELSNSFVYVPLVVYLYAIGDQEQSVSRAGFMKHAKEHELVLKTILPIVDNNDKFKQIVENQVSLQVRHQFEVYLLDTKFKNDFYEFHKYIKKEHPYYLRYIGRSTKMAIHFKFTYKYMVKHISSNSNMAF